MTPLTPSADATPVDLLLTAMTPRRVAWLRARLDRAPAAPQPRPALIAGTDGRATRARSTCSCGARSLRSWLLVVRSAAPQRRLPTNVDLLHFSLHPLERGAARAGVRAGAAACHRYLGHCRASRLPAIVVRMPRTRCSASRRGPRGSAARRSASRSGAPAPDVHPMRRSGLALAVSARCAAALARLRPAARHASQTVRLGASSSRALLTPSLAMYPSLLAFATEAKERLIADEFGPEATEPSRRPAATRAPRARSDRHHARAGRVRHRLRRRNAVDRSGFSSGRKPTSATYRLTSAVELYDPDGRLLSRFALNLPEVRTRRTPRPPSCHWEAPFDELSPFGSSERHVLRASRGICVRGTHRRRHRRPRDARLSDAAVHRVAEPVSRVAARRTAAAPAKAPRGATSSSRSTAGAERPSTSGPRVWTLPDDAVFERLIASRAAVLGRRSIAMATRFRVYFLSDRGGIYALGLSGDHAARPSDQPGRARHARWRSLRAAGRLHARSVA